jgi:hypothetical protein
MTDNQLFALIIATLQAGLTTQAITVGIQQDYQPRLQGAPLAPTLFLTKLGDHRYGTAHKKAVNTSPGQGTVTETQQVETTFQVGALAIQDPADTTGFTASDYANVAAQILASDVSVAAFVSAGAQILRITEVRNPQFKDERDQFEASPSFDFVLKHFRTLVNGIPYTGTIVGEVFPVV